MAFPTICVDCSPLLVRSAGVKTYLYHWLRAMRAARPESVRTFLAAGLEELTHGGGPGKHPGRLAALTLLNRVPEFAMSAAVPACDVFHASNLLRRLPKRRRLTATVHDLTTWILPEFHTSATLAADTAFAEKVLKRADGLIAVSESTRRDAIRILGIRPEKIRTIHSGVPAAYSSVSKADFERVRAAYSLGRGYFLSAGTIEPRKNIDTLLSAWEALPGEFRAEYELIVAGMPGWRSEATVRRLAQAGAGVRSLGYVPERDMPALTAGARAFVYPSLYEGFGIPVVQAMAAGCPVITADVSSLPEVTGGAAALVDPRSAAELSAAMRRVGESESVAAELRARGLERAKAFTWERTAAESLRFFGEIASG